MSTMLIQSGTLDDIADAIRSKTGKVASMTPLEMPDEIESISGGGSGLPILSGISNPNASQGTDGQEYLKYANYIYSSFMDGTIIVRENVDDATDIKLFVYGFSRANTDLVPITDTDLLDYLSDITTGKFKACDIYNSSQSTQYVFVLMNQSGNMFINVTNSAVTSRVSGTFYGGMIDLNQAPVSSASNYQKNGYKTCNTDIDELVTNGFVKKNGVWQELLENTDIDDIILSVGGGGITILSGTSEPTSSQGADGQIYLKCGENGVDLSTFTFRNTGGVTCVSTKYALTYTYNSGSSIAAESNLQMDLTNVNEVKFTLSKFHKNYDNTRVIRVYIENTLNPASNWIASSSLTPDATISTNDTTNTYTVNVSEYTGNYWIVVTSHGVSGEFKDLIVDGQVVENYITETKLKVNGAWQDLINSNIDDVNLGN